jgi:hypothetical protein
MKVEFSASVCCVWLAVRMTAENSKGTSCDEGGSGEII